MKHTSKLALVLPALLFGTVVSGGELTDTYTTGDTITTTTFENIKTEINDNDARLLLMEQLFVLDVSQGPQADVPVVKVLMNGWSQCYQDLYNNSGTPIATILSDCSKANLMLACKEVGSEVYKLLAAAPRADATFDTGNNATTTHAANGTEWYFNDSRSWGFAKGGDAVSKTTCDTGVPANPELRLCFHTSGGNISGGWRCGATEVLNNQAGWERVILHKD